MEKILYIITQSDWGGAQRYVFDLAINLQKSQYRTAEGAVHIAAGGSGPLFDRLEAQKLPTTRLKHLKRPINPYHDLMAYFEIKKLLNHINPDIVHLNSSKAGFLGSLAAKKVGIAKIVYTAHGFVFNEPLPAWKKWLYKKIELASSKLIDKIICVSDFDRQTGIAGGIDSEKLITIHNGIDVDTMNFLPREQAILSLRGAAATKQSNQRNGQGLQENLKQHDDKIAAVGSTLPRNDRVIGCVANFYPSKGLDILIQAMTKIDATLIIIGDGPEKKNLQLIAYNLQLQDKVLLVGSVPDAFKYLKAFDLFVLPSRKEGLPYVLLEAAAAGVPIVATKVGGVPEIISDRQNGYLVQPDNTGELVDKINYALAHPLPPVLAADFTLATMIAKTLTAYSS